MAFAFITEKAKNTSVPQNPKAVRISEKPLPVEVDVAITISTRSLQAEVPRGVFVASFSCW